MTKKIRAVIVDDEIHCVETLTWQMSQYCPEINLVSSFVDAVECRDFLAENDVDLLLVDVEMPMLNGIDMLAAVSNPKLNVVYTTAYGDIEGLDDSRVMAVLLKPIDHSELTAVVERLTKA